MPKACRLEIKRASMSHGEDLADHRVLLEEALTSRASKPIPLRLKDRLLSARLAVGTYAVRRLARIGAILQRENEVAPRGLNQFVSIKISRALLRLCLLIARRTEVTLEAQLSALYRHDLRVEFHNELEQFRARRLVAIEELSNLVHRACDPIDAVDPVLKTAESVGERSGVVHESSSQKPDLGKIAEREEAEDA